MTRPIASAAALLLLPLAACGSTDVATSTPRINRAHGIPIRAGEIQGPGTTLHDGLKVPHGAVLAGEALQANEESGDPTPIPIRSWSAVLGVKGRPLKVIHAFADQAAAAGLDFIGRGTCVEAQASPPNQGGPSLPPTPARCVLTGSRFNVRIETIPRHHAIGFVQFREFGEHQQHPPRTPTSTLATDPRFAPDPSVNLPAFRGPAKGTIPDTGEPVDIDIDIDIARIRVQRGSQMVVAAYSANGSSNPDEALIRVTNNAPLAVFRAYLAASKRAGLPRRHELTPKDSAGWTVRTVYVNDGTESGERGGTAQLFTRSNQAYIRIYMYAG